MHKYGVCILYGLCGTQQLVPPRGLEKAKGLPKGLRLHLKGSDCKSGS